MINRLLILLLLAPGPGLVNAEAPSLLLSYDQPPIYLNPEPSTQFMDPAMSFPSSDWQREGMPIGNGRIGAMVFGDPLNERIQFNDISLWTGGANPSGGYEIEEFGSYQNFGDLFIKMQGQEGFDDFNRSLDLATGIHTTCWTHGGVGYSREVFASHPDESIIIRLSADQPGKIDAEVRLVGAHEEETQSGDGTLRFVGTLSNKLRYAAQVSGRSVNGRVQGEGDYLHVTGDSVTLILNAATDYAMDPARNFRNGKDPVKTIEAQSLKAIAKGDDLLRRSHLEDFSPLMSRVVLDLAEAPAGMSLPERLKAYREGREDPHLEMLLFQYGRYLLASSSRHSLPSNLQGLWNDMNHPAWYCDYHTNINIQMNYWPVEVANLSECGTPLFDWIEASIPGSRLATQKAFGEDTPGWAMRTSVNIFGGNGWEWNMASSGWLALHYWERYAFTQDEEFLRKRAWPVFEEVSRLWLHKLVEREGKLVVPDSWSPEHGPTEDGCAHDQQIVWSLFTHTLSAAEILGIDNEFTRDVRQSRGKLLGPQIGSWGQIMEWMVERPVLEKSQHRHTSHLFAVFPGNQITLSEQPELAKAAQVSLAARGNAGDSRRSWTWGWRCALWARLGMSSPASDMIRGQLTWNSLPNLLATHPPFQFDGNSGITAGICEMLVQSHAGEISLLPAIPLKRKWRSGSFSGLKARGGFEVGASWDKRTITGASIHSKFGHPVVLRLPLLESDSIGLKSEDGKVTEVKAEADGSFRFPTQANARYKIVMTASR
ncbi:MAG: glycoside hydrolase family 95 protein [Haloferula sp.]